MLYHCKCIHWFLGLSSCRFLFLLLFGFIYPLLFHTCMVFPLLRLGFCLTCKYTPELSCRHSLLNINLLLGQKERRMLKKKPCPSGNMQASALAWSPTSIIRRRYHSGVVGLVVNSFETAMKHLSTIQQRYVMTHDSSPIISKHSW